MEPPPYRRPAVDRRPRSRVRPLGMPRPLYGLVTALVLVAGITAWETFAPGVFDLVRAPLATRVLAQVDRSFVACVNGRPLAGCVVDGDTLKVDGTTIRIADIDAPEVFSPSCPAERALGEAASRRLLALVREGPFDLAAAPDGRDEDPYGRKLRVLVRNGASLGEALVAEGVARRWNGARRSWC